MCADVGAGGLAIFAKRSRATPMSVPIFRWKGLPTGDARTAGRMFRQATGSQQRVISASIA
jgi:hypothetical protein